MADMRLSDDELRIALLWALEHGLDMQPRPRTEGIAARALLDLARLVVRFEQHVGDGYDEDSGEQCPYCLWVPGRDWDSVHSAPGRLCDLMEARLVVRAAQRAGLRDE